MYHDSGPVDLSGTGSHKVNKQENVQPMLMPMYTPLHGKLNYPIPNYSFGKKKFYKEML